MVRELIKIRVMFDHKNELEEALQVVREISKHFSREYKVKVNRKIYWNTREKKKNTGGRIYITLTRKRE